MQKMSEMSAMGKGMMEKEEGRRGDGTRGITFSHQDGK